jgi:hypothetical protein
MKKNILRPFRKLRLSKATLRHLDSAALHRIAGGLTLDLIDNKTEWTIRQGVTCWTCQTCASGAHVCCA